MSANESNLVNLSELWRIQHENMCRRVDEHESRLLTLETTKVAEAVNYARLSQDVGHVKQTLDDMKQVLDKMAMSPTNTLSDVKRYFIQAVITGFMGTIIAALVWAIANMQ